MENEKLGPGRTVGGDCDLFASEPLLIGYIFLNYV